MSNSNSAINNNNTTSSSTTGGSSSTSSWTGTSSFSHNIASTSTTASSYLTASQPTTYKSPFPNSSSVQPGRESKFTEHFEYSEWKNMPSVVDHSKHFELMAVPIEHERKEAAEEKEKNKKSWKW